jgi:hypothetical protein
MMKLAVISILAFVAACPASCQDMPYSLAYTFTAITTSADGLAVTSTSVANTYGSSGHTAAALTVLRSPGGRSAAANMYHDFQSSASTSLPVCTESGCEDGEWEAEGGGEEYCPIAMAYLAVAGTQDRKETPPVVMVTRVTVEPARIPRQNGTATLSIHAVKSPRCPGAILHGSFGVPTGMVLDREPESGLVNPQWNLDQATGLVKAITPLANNVAGVVDATGMVENAPGCEVKGTPQTTRFTVE